MARNVSGKATFFISLLILTACAGPNVGAKFSPSDLEGISDKFATVFFYASDSGLGGGALVPIIANNTEIGALQFGAYIKKQMEPGEYKIHSESGFIDRQTDFTFEAGKTYFVKRHFGRIPFADYFKFILISKEEALPEIEKTSLQLRNSK